MGQLIKVAEANEVPPGTAKVVEADGRRIALFNCDGGYYAIDDVCTHRGGSLSEGEVNGTAVTCPWPSHHSSDSPARHDFTTTIRQIGT